jgi:hypothetical protein
MAKADRIIAKAAALSIAILKQSDRIRRTGATESA